MKKIAPTLQEVADSFAVTVNRGERYPADVTEAFRRELRALLSVARAADRHHSHAEVPYDPIDESWRCGICRALARLSRASQPRRKT